MKDYCTIELQTIGQFKKAIKIFNINLKYNYE